MKRLARPSRSLPEIGVLPILSVDPTRTAGRSAAELAPLYGHLFDEVLKSGLNMSWARDLPMRSRPWRRVTSW